MSDTAGVPASGFLQALPAAARARFERLAHSKKIPAGAAIFRDRAPVDDVILIRDGQVRLWCATPGGREVVLESVGPGELLGEASALAGLSSAANATAVEQVHALALSASDFRAFLRDTPEATRHVAERIARRLRDAEAKRVELATCSVLASVAGRLVERLAQHERVVGCLGHMTDRERAVLVLIAEGLNNAEISEALVMSRRTVEWYVGEVLTKLDIGPEANGARRVKAVLAYQRATSVSE